MTGLPDENRPAFRHATEVLRGLGYEVISPDELDAEDDRRGRKMTWEDYLRRDLKWLAKAEVAFALHGWQYSRGAQLEATILGRLGVPIIPLAPVTYAPCGSPLKAGQIPTPTFPPLGADGMN